MIDRQLDPVRLGVPGDLGEILQSLMLTYLARYNATGPSVNTGVAYRRAFGVTELQAWARVGGGRPGFMVYRIPYSWGDHLVVSLEGATGMSQLWAMRYGVDAVLSTDGLPGKVWGTVKAYTDDVIAALAASPWFTGLWTSATTQITFTGHSLGAGMASVLAARYRKNFPERVIRVRKFGCMRYCDQAWLDGYARDIDVVNFYTDTDPVICIPATGQASLNVLGGSVPYWGTALTVEAGMFCSTSGFFQDWKHRHAGLTAMDVYAMAFLPLGDPRNYWPAHWMDNYRLAAMNLVAHNRDLLEMRINYLEHNDENQWQVRFRPRTNIDDSWKVLADPPPEPFATWTGEQLRLHGQGVPQPVIGPDGVQRDDAGGGGEHNWGVPDTLTALRRRRAQHTPIVR